MCILKEGKRDREWRRKTKEVYAMRREERRELERKGRRVIPIHLIYLLIVHVCIPLSLFTPLQEVSVGVVSAAACQAALRNTRLGPRYVLHPGMLCAGGEAGKDACKVGVYYVWCDTAVVLLVLPFPLPQPPTVPFLHATPSPCSSHVPPTTGSGHT